MTGELKISYFVVDQRETLDGLKSGLQNRKVGDQLTLNDVQLGPIAWQIYAGDNADLTIKNSTINEIGIFGHNAKVQVEEFDPAARRARGARARQYARHWPFRDLEPKHRGRQ